jgi:hypothetical protein
MKRSAAGLLTGLALLVARLALAETPAPPSSSPAATPSATATPAPAPAAPAKPATTTPQHFEPTEKVRADFDVSFPIDI